MAQSDSLSIKQPIRIDVNKMYQAFNSYAGRVAKTDDPRAHQQAAQILQDELKASRISACQSR